MIATNLPQGVRLVADNLKDCFEHPSYQGIAATISYFLLGQKSVCEMVRNCSFAKSVSSQIRVIHSFDQNRAHRRLLIAGLKSLSKSNPEDIVYAIDDTSNPKYSKNIFGSGFWGSSSGVYYGQKIVAIALVDLKRKISIPISYAILSKEQLIDQTSLDVGIQLFSQLKDFGFPTKTVVADSWFDSANFASKLESLGFNYVWQTKSNRLVKTNTNRFSPWIHFNEAFKDQARFRTVTDWDQKKIRNKGKRGKCISEIYCQITARKSPLKIVAVFNRRNAKSPYGYFASTDKSLSRARIWMISRARWAIEIIFRAVKQNLSFGNLTCTGEEAAHLAVCLPFYLYVMLQTKDPETWGLKQIESVDRMVAKIKAQTQTKSILKIVNSPQSPSTELLRNRLSVSNASRKPTNKPAGRGGQAA